jgi:hypothetical protein
MSTKNEPSTPYYERPVPEESPRLRRQRISKAYRALIQELEGPADGSNTSYETLSRDRLMAIIHEADRLRDRAESMTQLCLDSHLLLLVAQRSYELALKSLAAHGAVRSNTG